MKKFLSALCATALTASVAVTGALPANSAPIFVPKAPTVEHSDVSEGSGLPLEAARRSGWSEIRKPPEFSNNNWDGSRRNWDGPRRNRPQSTAGITAIGATATSAVDTAITTASGSRLAAFITGAIIGGAIANSNELLSRRRRQRSRRSGAMTATGRTGLTTTRSSPITGRAGSAIRLIADSWKRNSRKARAVNGAGLFVWTPG